MSNNPSIQVFLADDHALFRLGIKTVFQRLKNEAITLIGEAANGFDVLNAITKQQPHVILMDVEMPQLNGIETTLILKRSYPDIRVIGLSYTDHNKTVMEMVKAGADGYLVKDTTVEELIEAIKTVYSGYSYFTPIVNYHLSAEVRVASNNQKKQQLTKRETEILQLICQGDSSKEIASTLYVSKRTVDSFREKIMRKAGVKNLLQLFRYALKEKLIKD